MVVLNMYTIEIISIECYFLFVKKKYLFWPIHYIPVGFFYFYAIP